MNNLKVFDHVFMETGECFAILIDTETKEAYEAVWDKENNRWETDFSYNYLKTEAEDVASALDFRKCRKEGYRFID